MMHVLWLEDRPESVRFDKIKLEQSTNYKFEMVESPYEVMARITDPNNEYDKLLLDIMIPSTLKLMINGEPYSTNYGLETGLVLYEYFLYEHFKKEVVFYTSRKITQSLKDRVARWKNTKLIQKKDLELVLISYLNKDV